MSCGFASKLGEKRKTVNAKETAKIKSRRLAASELAHLTSWDMIHAMTPLPLLSAQAQVTSRPMHYKQCVWDFDKEAQITLGGPQGAISL